jgi:hypothetical protein
MEAGDTLIDDEPPEHIGLFPDLGVFSQAVWSLREELAHSVRAAGLRGRRCW